MKMIDSKLQSWILASRPKTLPAAFVPVLVGSSLAIHFGKFIFHYSLIALACALLIQIGTNFTNDLYDFISGADNEKRKGPLRVLASGLISPAEMKLAIILVFLITFLLGLYLVSAAGWVILLIGVASIISGIAYTAGPFPLAYNGLGDVFVFIFFGIVAVMGTSYLHLEEFSFLSFIVSLPIGALVTNILLVNNFRDIEEDRLARKKTLAVLLGKSFTRFEFVFFLIISLVIPFVLNFYYDFSVWIFLPLLSFPIGAYLVNMLYTLDGSALNKTLELSAKFSALYGILLSIGLVL